MPKYIQYHFGVRCYLFWVFVRLSGPRQSVLYMSGAWVFGLSVTGSRTPSRNRTYKHFLLINDTQERGYLGPIGLRD